jgi:hypothetical protein
MFSRMRFMVFLLVCGLVSGVGQSVAIAVAGASGGSDGGNTVTVVVTTVSATPGRTGSSGSGLGGGRRDTYVCSYTIAPPSMTVGLPEGGPEAGHFYLVSCTGPGVPPGPIVVWMANLASGVGEGVTPTAVGERAASSIRLPSPVIETNPAGSTVVNIQTWLWVSSSIWHPWTARASVSGITATATATPVRVAFDMGDGAQVVCDGPGSAYNPAEMGSAKTSSCSYVYRSSSAGQESPDGNPNDAAYTVTATITWDVSWKGDGFVGGGTLPPLTTTSTTHLRVEQIESVQQS